MNIEHLRLFLAVERCRGQEIEDEAANGVSRCSQFTCASSPAIEKWDEAFVTAFGKLGDAIGRVVMGASHRFC